MARPGTSRTPSRGRSRVSRRGERRRSSGGSPPLWPSLLNTGYFTSDELAAHVVAAAAGGESWGVLLGFRHVGSVSARLITCSDWSATQPLAQYYTNATTFQTIVQVPGPTATHFATWGAVLQLDDFLAVNCTWAAGIYTVSAHNITGALTPSVGDPFAATDLSSALDRFTWGALRRNGGVEFSSDNVKPVCAFFRRGGIIGTTALGNFRTAYSASGSLHRRATSALAYLEAEAGSNCKLSHVFQLGAPARVGTTPVPGGTLIWETE